MVRPRKHDIDLPPRMQRKHGSYYLVVKNKWINLGKDRDTAIANLESAAATATISMNEKIWKYTANLVAKTRANAKGRGKIFNLTIEDVRTLIEQAQWRCAVTKIQFSLEPVPPHKMRPFAPSIDRINSALGYTRENCRIVCVAANYAMNRWGDSVLRAMLGSMRRSSKRHPIDI